MKKGDTKKFIRRLLTGDTLLGKELVSDNSKTYIIADKIGEGAMGAVYEAHDDDRNGFAIKVATIEQGIKRFRLEIAILKLVGKHPNIPELTDWGLDKSDIKFCVMDYVPGQTLKDIIDKKAKWFYADTLLNSIEISFLLLTALHHVHNKKIIHRDVKPSNIIISRMPSGALMLKLMDFGIAKTLEKGFLSFLHRKITFDEKTLTLPGQPIGTLGYAPKEQIDNDNPRESADIFSCGITILEMLLATPLLPSKTISEYMNKLDAFVFKPFEFPGQDPYIVNEFNRIISKSLEKDPKKRYRRAGKMLKDFVALKKHMEKTKNNPL